MDRQKAIVAFLVVVSLGVVITTVGMMIASGVYHEGDVSASWQVAFQIFIVLYFIGMAAFLPGLVKDKQNQSQRESDLSLD